MKKNRKRSREASGSQREAAPAGFAVKPILMGAGFGLVVFFAFVLLFALLVWKSVLPAELLSIYGGCSVFAGGLVCAFLARGGRHRFVSILLGSALMLLLLAVIGTAAFSGFFVVKNLFLVLIILLISSIIGNIITTALH